MDQNQTPSFFEPNRGQADSRYDFLWRGRSGVGLLSATHWELGGAEVRIAGGRVSQAAQPLEPLPGVVNYYRRGFALSGIPTYAGLRYENVYPGIDVRYYETEGQLEFDFEVRPGADPGRIELEFASCGEVGLDADGREVSCGPLRLRQLRLFQLRGGQRVPVAGRFVQGTPGSVRFRVGKYDRSSELVIDPLAVVYYSVANTTRANVIRQHPSGDFVLAGDAMRHESRRGIAWNPQAMVLRIRPDGPLVFVTFLGVAGNLSNVEDAVIDSSGEIYATGGTNPEWPGISPGDTAPANRWAFVAKLSSTGSLTFSRVFPGAVGRGIEVDEMGQLIVTGNTVTAPTAGSTPTPSVPITPGVFQPVYGGGNSDAYVMKLNPSNGGVIWASYLGGNSFDVPEGLAIDKSGRIYVVGWGLSTNFPAANPLMSPPSPDLTAVGRLDFLARVSADGRTLEYAIRLPYFSQENRVAVAVDAQGQAVVGGTVWYQGFTPPVGAYQPAYRPNVGNIALMKVNASGTALVGGTYIGVQGRFDLKAMALDSQDRVVVAAHLGSPQGTPDLSGIPPSSGFLQAGAKRVVVMQFDAAAQKPLNSTGPAGIPGLEDVYSIAVDARGRVFVSGSSAGAVGSGSTSPASQKREGTDAVVVIEWPTTKPTELVKISGDGQIVKRGGITPNPLIVEVRDGDGKPMPDVQVEFRGRNRSTPSVIAKSDALGRALGRVVVGESPGKVAIDANAGGVAPVVFEMNVVDELTIQVPNHVQRSPVSFRISTVVGPSAGLNLPEGLAVDATGTIFVADTRNHRIRRIDAAGVATTVTVASGSRLTSPHAVALGADGHLLIGDDIGLWRVPAGGGELTPAYPTSFYNLIGPVQGVVPRPGNEFLWTNFNRGMIHRVVNGVAYRVAGGVGTGDAGDGGPGIHARISSPRGLARDSQGNVYVSDTTNSRIRKIAADGIITTVAGTGSVGYSGDGETATQAKIWDVRSVAVDSSGTLFFADPIYPRVRMLTKEGILQTVAGSGRVGYSGDGGLATAGDVRLYFPQGIFVDAKDDIYISDSGNNAIRKLARMPAEAPPPALLPNAASYQTGAIAPNEFVTLFGSGIADSLSVAAESPLPAQLAGVSVIVKDSVGVERPAAMYAVAPGQMSFRVPSEVAQGPATLTITNAKGEATTLQTKVDLVAPGLFTAQSNGRGAPAATVDRVAANGARTSEFAFQCGTQGCSPRILRANRPGESAVLVLYGTGIRNRTSLGAVEAWIGGVRAEVLYAGAQGSEGLDQVNLAIPAQLDGKGFAEVVLSVDGKMANPVSLEFTAPARLPYPVGWDFYSSTDGFTMESAGVNTVEDGIWTLDPTGTGAAVNSPDLDLPTAAFRYVKLRLSASCDGKGAVFFRTVMTNTYAGSRAVPFDAQACPGCTPAPFRELSIDMSGNPEWLPGVRLRGIRIQPCSNGDVGSVSDQIRLDSIRVSATP